MDDQLEEVLNNESTLALSDLYFIEQQKKALLRNTILFAEDKLSNNALLWGARGNGKSSLIDLKVWS